MPALIDYNAQLNESLANPDFSVWNHTSLKGIGALVAGYDPLDLKTLIAPDIRAKAAKLMDQYLTASHYYNLMPNFLLTDYGKEFKKLRRVAFRLLSFYRSNPTTAVPLDTVGAWMRAEGLPWTP